MIIPRYYQKQAVQSIWDYYKAGNTGNPLIALPTGTGKSLVNTMLIQQILDQYPNQRILCLTHVKELIEQNYKALIRNWPTAPAGIYSASVGRKDVGCPITFAGIGSVYRKANIFQHTDIIIVDEAHLIGPNSDSMYGKFLKDLKRFNPLVIVIGMTATPYRIGQGHLTDGRSLFTDICFDLTGMEAFNRLIDEGFLAPLFPLRTKTELDVEGIRINSGEFSISQMQERYNVDKITRQAIEESIINGQDRKHWLIFATGVDHCDRIAAMMTDVYNIPCEAVHSKLGKRERENVLAAFTSGRLRAVVNNNVLTTGFDYPEIDMIVVLRPTNSPGLWVQMLGRGTRPHENKTDCLVLDFAANTKRLGPINDPVLPKPPKKRKTPGEAPVRICENCGMYNHASVRVCKACGFEFPITVKIRSESAQEELIKRQAFDIQIFKVNGGEFSIHQKEGKPDSLKVSYFCGNLRVFSHWVCLDHPEPAAKNGRDWWRQMSPSCDYDSVPASTQEAISRVQELVTPCYLRVRLDTKYPQIMDYDLDGTGFGADFEQKSKKEVAEEDDIPF